MKKIAFSPSRGAAGRASPRWEAGRARPHSFCRRNIRTKRIVISLSRGAAGGASREMTVRPHGFEQDRAVSGVRRPGRPAAPGRMGRRPRKRDRPREESNLRARIRSPSLYPLSYGARTGVCPSAPPRLPFDCRDSARFGEFAGGRVCGFPYRRKRAGS